MELINSTRYPGQIVVMPDPHGAETLTAVLKATWSLAGGGEPAQEQVALILADTYHGEPGASSPRLETDLAPAKAATDVVMIGHAYAPKKTARVVDVSLEIGSASQRVRVFGDRHWWLLFGFFPRRSGPKAFEKLPLIYERAFGGFQPGGKKGSVEGFEARNPVGRGYVRKKRRSFLNGLALPNMENPRKLIGSPGQAPAPVGFGYIARSWSPRRELLGTYDEDWQQNRMPLLPDDYDERSWNGAHPSLQISPFLRGDERVRAVGVTRGKPLEFRLPGLAPAMTAHWLGKWQDMDPVLDTVVIEPDEQRVCLTWRASLRIHGQIRKLTAVKMSVVD